MTLLQFILIISSVFILLFAIDAYQRKKVNFLHFIVFLGGTGIILLFSFDVDLLNKFGKFFGLTRGADLLVYLSIIMLGYFYFEMLNKITKDSYNFSRFVSMSAVEAIDTSLLGNKVNQLKKDDKTDYLFLLRAYNEGKKIGEVIDDIVNKGFKKIVVINDGSIDETRQVVQDKILKYGDLVIVLVNHLINRGGGAANKTGFNFISSNLDLLQIKRVVTFDSDGQMMVDDMDLFIKSIQQYDPDILLGSRFIKGSSVTNIPLSRRIVLFGSKIVTLIFGGIWVSDPHNGYRVIKADILGKLKINSDGMTYSSELVEEIKRLKLKAQQVPVNIVYTEYSLSKGQKNSNAIRILLEIIYKKFFFK